MPFDVQQESLDAVRHEAVSTLQATRSLLIDEQRFAWLYENNPDGPAVLWSVRCRDSGEMAGFTVCLPRRMLVNGEPINAWNGADFSILPRYRTLGIAVKLRRAARTAVDAGEVQLLYAHPNQRMQLIHERVGHLRVGRMIRCAKPLSLAARLPNSLPARAVRAVDATLGRAVTFSAAEFLHKPQHCLKLFLEPRFDAAYDQLFADLPDKRAFIGVRDAVYLNWRYRENPLGKFHMISAKQSDQLQGYLIFSVCDRVVHVQDIFARGLAVMKDLVVELTRIARQQHQRSISMTLLEHSPIASVLLGLGFRVRPDYSDMLSYAASGPLRSQLTDPTNWHVHCGDRDV